MVDVARAEQRRDGTERLLAERGHGVGDAVEDGRRVEVALPGRRGSPPTSGSAPMRARLVDLALERVAQVAAGQRADVRLARRGVADAQGAHGVGEARAELVGHRLLHDEALGGDAALAVVLVARAGSGARGVLEVRHRRGR